MNLPLAAISGGFIALWSIFYFVLLVTLGVISIRKGHWVMFIVGHLPATLLVHRSPHAPKSALRTSGVDPESPRSPVGSAFP